MHKLLALSLKSTVACLLSVTLSSVAFATDDDINNEELSYTAELRREAVSGANKPAPDAAFQQEAEILNEDDRRALAKATKEDLSKVNTIKPSFAKPKLSQPHSN